jgi:hypothetical protein
VILQAGLPPQQLHDGFWVLWQLLRKLLLATAWAHGLAPLL